MLARVDQEAAEMLAQHHSVYNMSAVDQERMQLGFDVLDEAYKDLVQAQFGDKIARGTDGFAEFALRPQYEHEELSEVVDGLYQKDILAMRADARCFFCHPRFFYDKGIHEIYA